MAFRGRGRGRGYGGGFRIAKQEPLILFPDIENFPDVKSVTEETALVIWNSRLQKFWNSSPYYYEGDSQGIKESTEIKRFSGKDNKRTKPKGKLLDFIFMTDEYVPAELAQGSKQRLQGKKNRRWDPGSDLQKLDLFEKLEQKYQGQDEKDGKEKKEDENEEEDDEIMEEEDEEFSDDGDYNQNIDFDDDEDDFNMDDDNDDEAMY
uniref:Putative DNA-directed RNA polymerase III subunit rpc31 isoform X2 n=1 Tax=Davidia involucrata TaxID=16924 RepID=A0A5B7CBK0_DAVIN